MIFISLYLQFQNQILLFAMIYARLAIVFHLLPIFGDRILSGLVVKNTLIAVVIIGLWPCLLNEINTEQGWFYLLAKELVIGLLLGVSLCLPFWIVTSVGELIDNQRGATLSDSIDPVNGGQSSVISGFLNFTFGAIFFANGGVKIILESMIYSYEILPRGNNIIFNELYNVGGLIIFLVKNAIILASPVLMIMMITELLLGVFAKYCPQLNPFSLSLTLKSIISFFVFLLYGFTAIAEKPIEFFLMPMFHYQTIQ